MENHKQVIFGFANNEMAELQLYKDSEKYWSPQLQIRIEENEENSDFLEIRGVFGPRSSVWTFFMFLYGLGGAIKIGRASCRERVEVVVVEVGVTEEKVADYNVANASDDEYAAS